MPAADLLARLESVRETGPGKWMARCPAHEDRSPSLSVARGDDRWLIHCFSGCFSIDVMRAVGLELADLYDDRRYRPRGDRERPRLTAREALVALDHEIRVAAIIAADMLAQRTIDAPTWDRLAAATACIAQSRALICPDRPR